MLEALGKIGILITLCSSLAVAQAASTSQPGPVNAESAKPAEALRADVPTRTSAAESWTALPIKESGLPLDLTGGVVLSKIDEPEFTRELVRVEWRLGDPIELYVIRPHGVTKPPVILYLYNYTSDTDRYRDDGWCRRATKDGFAAVGFVSALSGQRFHAPRPMRQWFVSELQEALVTSTHDVQMVISYLARRADVDLNRLGMFGQGSGGTIALLAASVDKRIAAVDVIDPWGSWPEWLKDSRQIPEDERKAYLNATFLSKVSPLDPVRVLPSIKTKSVRIQEVMDDPITPDAARTKIIAAVPTSDTLVRFDSAAQHMQAYHLEGLSKWLESQLSSK